MLIVDASSLYEVLTGGRHAAVVSAILDQDDDHAAPHLIDAEVLGAVRKDYVLGRLDGTAARGVILGLQEWRGRRFHHTDLLERAWELRANVRSWDAFYVALAEALGGTLVTVDQRLARAPGLRCAVQAVGTALRDS